MAVFFKPQGVPLQQLKGLTLSVDGLEALRLADAEGLDQETAAAMMDISRPTFSRLVGEARATVAKALVNGWAIRIEGGDFEMTAPASPGQGGQGRRARARRTGRLDEGKG